MSSTIHTKQDLPLNDPPRAKLEAQRCTPVVARVEFGSVRGKFAPVVHLDVVPFHGLAVALDGVGGFNAEVGGLREAREGEGDDRSEGWEMHCVVCEDDGGELVVVLVLLLRSTWCGEVRWPERGGINLDDSAG